MMRLPREPYPKVAIMTDSKPVGWRVSGVPVSDHAELIKQTPFEINCKTKEEAEHQKQMMKERGWVATVTPIFGELYT
jgi:hypothetical protein